MRRKLHILWPSMCAAQLCSYSHHDPVRDEYWTFDLSELQKTADYEVSTEDGSTIRTNVCRLPSSRCLPATPAALSSPQLGSAIHYWGAQPPPTSQCFLHSDVMQQRPVACTQMCTVLGCGALGVSAEWALLDPSDPAAGLRATHTLPTLAQPVPNETSQRPGAAPPCFGTGAAASPPPASLRPTFASNPPPPS